MGPYRFHITGRLACSSAVERIVYNGRVAGSIPATPSLQRAAKIIDQSGDDKSRQPFFRMRP